MALPFNTKSLLPSIADPARHRHPCAPARATAQQPHNRVAVGPPRPRPQRANVPTQTPNAPELGIHEGAHGAGCSGSSSRREVLLSCASWPLVLASVTGSNDATTIINSVLGGYFLPQLPNSQGFKFLDEIEDDFTLE